MLAMLEEDDDDPDIAALDQIDIVMMPPENATGNVTDEDSGPEDGPVLDNLPGSQLRAPAEIQLSRSDDESEDATTDDAKETKKKKAKNKKKKKIYDWKHNCDIEMNDEPWPEKEGPYNELTPETLFSLFFDDDVIDHIVTYSNQYAAKKNKLGDISREEMKAFLGVLLLSGYVTVPRRKMYWQSQKDSNNQVVCEAISRDRFDFIMSNLHVCNNDTLDGKDRFGKVRPLFEMLNQRFQDFAPHERNHSVDETMVPYFGRHGCKQFIRGKPIRWGYKLWTGATKRGYVVWSEPYQGKGDTDGYGDFGLSGSVILSYAKVLRNIGSFSYHLHFDNFFTSVDLLGELGRQRFLATGTLRENRLGGCPIKKKSELKKEERGAMSKAADLENNIVICSWNDNNIVTIGSNAVPVNPIHNVSRYSQKLKKRILIPQPSNIQTYNQNMGGVDRSDQNISLYRISIRGKKWYSSLLQYLIDVSEQNAWQLHRINGGKLDHLQFRRQVVMALLPARSNIAGLNRRHRPSQNLVEPGRYDNIGHFVIENERRTRCGHCHKQAPTRCQKCDVGVHVKCFVNYHTK